MDYSVFLLNIYTVKKKQNHREINGMKNGENGYHISLIYDVVNKQEVNK